MDSLIHRSGMNTYEQPLKLDSLRNNLFAMNTSPYMNRRSREYSAPELVHHGAVSALTHKGKNGKRNGRSNGKKNGKKNGISF